MTLQQKLLAKQSKKGFTLVELVVVIAILAILAAIAIPAVIGIINSATQSGGASDASTLNNACKSTYASIKSGAINNDDSTYPDGTKITFATAKTASASQKATAAADCKLEDVQKYNGTALHLGEDGDFWYADATDDNVSKGVTAGQIVYWDGQGDKPTGADKRLADDTKLSELYPDGKTES